MKVIIKAVVVLLVTLSNGGKLRYWELLQFIQSKRGLDTFAAFSNKIDTLLNSDGIFENMGVDTFSSDPLTSLSAVLSNPVNVNKAYDNFRVQLN